MATVPSWWAKVGGFEGVRALSHMNKSMAEYWLSVNGRELTEEEKQLALRAAKEDKIPQTAVNYDRVEQKFRAVAWLLGASYGQLAARAGFISRSTIVESLKRQLKVAWTYRDKLRAEQRLTLTQIDELHDRFMILANGSPRAFESTNAIDLAKILSIRPPDLETEAGDVEPDPMRRIEGEVLMASAEGTQAADGPNAQAAS